VRDAGGRRAFTPSAVVGHEPQAFSPRSVSAAPVRLDEEVMMSRLKNTFSSLAAVIGIVVFFATFSGQSVADQVSKPETNKPQAGEGQKHTRQRYAVAYSGYRTGQHPDRGNGAANPSDEEILEDLRILTRDFNFGLIRLYDSQENSSTVLRLIKENNLKLNVLLGIWLSAEISNHQGCPWLDEPIPKEVLKENKAKNRKEIKRGIDLANKYSDIVIAVNVGNEALVSWTDHLVDFGTVISSVRKVKAAISQPVTVAENYLWWAESGRKLAGELDFITVHSYPIWEGKDIDEAVSFTIANIDAVRKALPGTELIIGELGWATTASEFGARASEENQLRYFKEMTEWAAKLNVTMFWFEAFDEDWKGDPNNPKGAEKHFGLFTIDRKAKLVMQERYPDLK
jgi:exo-beta-1,3-glucanase (GH17 family)